MNTKTEPFEDTAIRGLAKSWNYDQCAFHRNLMALGQPSGWISVINLDTKSILSQFRAFEDIFKSYSRRLQSMENFHWTRILMNSKIIVISASWDRTWKDFENRKSVKRRERIKQTIIYSHGGYMLWSDNPTFGFLNRGRKSFCHMYFLDGDTFYVIDNKYIQWIHKFKISDIVNGKEISDDSGVHVCKTPFFRRASPS